MLTSVKWIEPWDATSGCELWPSCSDTSWLVMWNWRDGLPSFIKTNSVQLFFFMKVKVTPRKVTMMKECSYKLHEKDDVTIVL